MKKKKLKLRTPKKDKTPSKIKDVEPEVSEEELKRQEEERKKQEEQQAAKDAVTEYEQLKTDYYRDVDLFSQNFPEAQASLNYLNQLKDEINEQINVAKGLVKRAGLSVGDFKFSQPTSRPGFNGKKLFEALCSVTGNVPEVFEEAIDLEASSEEELLILQRIANAYQSGILLRELYDRGVLTEAKTDKETSGLVYASDDNIANHLEDAWDKGGTKLTPRCEVPKFGG